MKKKVVLLVSVLAFCVYSTTFGQFTPPSALHQAAGYDNFAPIKPSKPPAGPQLSPGHQAGINALTGLMQGIGQGLAQPRPPYQPPPSRQPQYSTQPRTVYVQQAATPTASTPQVELAKTASLSPLTLTPNITKSNAKPAPKDVIRKIKDSLKKDIIKQWDKIFEGIDSTAMNDDKAAALAKKLLDEGKDPKKVSELLVAISNDESDIAGKLVSDLTGDPLAGNQVAKEMKFGELLSEIEDQLTDGSVSASDLSAWKKAFAKMKLSTKQQKTVDKGLAAIKGTLEFIDLLSEYKENTKLTIPVPTDPVTIIYCPCLTAETAYALGACTFVAGTNEDMFFVDENYLDMFPAPPVYTSVAIPQTTTEVNAVVLTNATSQRATYYLDDGTARTLASDTQASFPVPTSGSVSVSSRGRKQSFTVEKGTYRLSYDGDNTWSIKSARVSVVLDNTHNPFPFQCFVNRSPHTIAAGDRLEMNAERGMIDVQFARDEDVSHTARYQFNASGTYKVGIDKRDGKWSLFPSEAILSSP